jgi:hypothetical protein
MKYNSLFMSLSRATVPFLLVLALSCKNANVNGPNGPLPSLIPLTVGNTWTSHWTHYDTLGSIQQSYSVPDMIMADTVLFGRHFTFYGGLWVVSTDTGIVYRTWDLNTPAGHDTLADYKLLFKYPTFSGDSYESFIVGRTDTVINVPAGTFTCIQYLGYNSELRIIVREIYVAPGVGIIKTIWRYGYGCYHDPSLIQSVGELTGYSIK